MGKFIVFKEKDFEEKIKGWIERRTYITSDNLISLFEDNATELSIDESIEERAKKKYNGLFSGKTVLTESLIVKYAIDCASEQSLIEQMKAKELKICIWCGRLSNEPIKETYVSCCPDYYYIPIKQYWERSTFIKK